MKLKIRDEKEPGTAEDEPEKDVRASDSTRGLYFKIENEFRLKSNQNKYATTDRSRKRARKEEEGKAKEHRR